MPKLRYQDQRTESLMHEKFGWWDSLSHKDQFRRAMVLHGENRKALPRVLGPSTNTWTGSCRNTCWRVPYGQSTFWVLASTEGTSIEWEPGVSNSEDVGPFLEWLYAKLMADEYWASADWSYMDKK